MIRVQWKKDIPVVGGDVIKVLDDNVDEDERVDVDDGKDEEDERVDVDDGNDDEDERVDVEDGKDDEDERVDVDDGKVVDVETEVDLGPVVGGEV